MRAGWLVLAVAACGSKDGGGGAGSGSAKPPAPPPVLQLARCVDAPPAFGPGPWGTIGLGGIGTLGHGAGTGYGSIGRSSSSPSALLGAPVAQGDLDKAIIRRYVRRNLSRIQFCYEKELLAKPNIQGSIHAQFFITPEGKVASVDASGFDPNVAKCIADVIKQIEFPKPRGGGGVQVNYPFNFRTAGTPMGAVLPPPPPPPDPRGGVDPQLARQQAIQQARSAGLIGAWSATADKPLEQWTPFARVAHTVDAGGTAATDAAVGEVVKSQLPQLEKCFAATDATGSVRVMIELDKDKGVSAVRAGGFGDPAIEQCVASAVRAGNFTPATQPHEVACDLVRGAAAPWRASIGKDYTLLGATRAGLVLDGQPRPPGEHHIVAERVALVLIEPDASAATIADAIKTAADAPAALVAVHGKTAELVGVVPAPDGHDADTVELTSISGTMHACRQDQDLGTGTVGSWVKVCPSHACSLRVVATTVTPTELAAVAAAARAAGVEIVGVATDPQCTL